MTAVAGSTEGVASALEQAIAEVVDRPVADPIDCATIPAAEAERLAAQFHLGSTTDLALAALPIARRIARPQISGYQVAAAGIEVETGDLVLGGNLEFPGTELTTTIHAEGFVALRARSRGHTLRTLALRVAHPCAHCRQVLAESAHADDLMLVDMEGARLYLSDLYPWPFRPASLGMDGHTPVAGGFPSLTAVEGTAPDTIAALLMHSGARAHAPYSGAPSAALLRTRDGRVVRASCVESVAFNPSISALQAALVELAAAGIDSGELAEGWLGCTIHGAVDPEPGFRALLAAVAPDATVGVIRWRVGA